MEPCGARLRVQRREGLGGKQKQEQEQRHPGEGNTEPPRVPDLVQWTRHMEAVKRQLLEQARGQLVELLDRAMWEAVQSYPSQDRTISSTPSASTSKTREPPLGKRKVFIIRKSLLDELMEVQHFRTIYHMFVAGLCVFIISTLAIDFIDEGRLVLQFDLLIFSFGQLPLALVTWVPMFLSTLLVPYQALRLWARTQTGGCWALGVPLSSVLLAAHASVLCILPIHVVVKHELQPASRCVLVFEQVRFLMKSYSFLRETIPGTLRVRGGEEVWTPSFSSYLYFLFCPTLIYRETYPRTSSIRWNYVAKNFAQALCCVLYACFILGRLCVPIFANMSQEPFSTRALVLSILHATLPGIFMLLLIFFAFLHCWLNAFAEMLQFGDRMFYRVGPGQGPAGSWSQGGLRRDQKRWWLCWVLPRCVVGLPQRAVQAPRYVMVPPLHCWMAGANCLCVDGKMESSAPRSREALVLKREPGKCCCLYSARSQPFWDTEGHGVGGRNREYREKLGPGIFISFPPPGLTFSTGLVELNLLLQLLPHMEHSGP
ncbi:sterol O-acyltransferase 2 isoform X4 [Fukomys damarensis]|uniref:sterol O-acyltransferase 2 isoform X4 n=1 Tax=Fukomys damarensis TaxID=885580 RepID=UPI00053F882C|nr:sterol O-acyltransferase 2 isoform X4 [Fukomys damarensis]